MPIGVCPYQPIYHPTLIPFFARSSARLSQFTSRILIRSWISSRTWFMALWSVKSGRGFGCARDVYCCWCCRTNRNGDVKGRRTIRRNCDDIVVAIFVMTMDSLLKPKRRGDGGGGRMSLQTRYSCVFWFIALHDGDVVGIVFMRSSSLSWDHHGVGTKFGLWVQTWRVLQYPAAVIQNPHRNIPFRRW